MSQLNFTAVADERELVGMVYEQEVFDDVVIAEHLIYNPTGRGGRDIWGGGKLGRKGKLNPDGTPR